MKYWVKIVYLVAGFANFGHDEVSITLADIDPKPLGLIFFINQAPILFHNLINLVQHEFCVSDFLVSLDVDNMGGWFCELNFNAVDESIDKTQPTYRPSFYLL